MTGKELRKQGVAILRAAGWVVRFMDHHKRTPTGMKGFPDIIAFKHGKTLLIEVKGEGDKLRPSQLEFWKEISTQLERNLLYDVVESVEGFEAWAE